VVLFFLAVAAAAGCSSAAQNSAADQAFLGDVHDSASDIGTYRSDAQLLLLGQAVCDKLDAGASYEAVADQLGIAPGADQLPTSDLGTVITAAAEDLCPQYKSQV
jgi:hypothetical protein